MKEKQTRHSHKYIMRWPAKGNSLCWKTQETFQLYTKKKTRNTKAAANTAFSVSSFQFLEEIRVISVAPVNCCSFAPQVQRSQSWLFPELSGFGVICIATVAQAIGLWQQIWSVISLMMSEWIWHHLADVRLSCCSWNQKLLLDWFSLYWVDRALWMACAALGEQQILTQSCVL